MSYWIISLLFYLIRATYAQGLQQPHELEGVMNAVIDLLEQRDFHEQVMSGAALGQNFHERIAQMLHVICLRGH